MYKHILLPTDGSSHAAVAIGNGIRLAAVLGAKVTGIYVTTGHLVSRGINRALLGDPDPAAMAGAFLAVVAAEAHKAGVPCDCVQVSGDSASEEIVRACDSLGCDLIAMASRGHGGIAQLLLGSETQRVLAHCAVPVLVYR